MTNARTLINSHLFCVDNLSDTEIREHLTKDGPPPPITKGKTYSVTIGLPIRMRWKDFTAKSWRVSICLAISLSVLARRRVWYASSTVGFR